MLLFKIMYETGPTSSDVQWTLVKANDLKMALEIGKTFAPDGIPDMTSIWVVDGEREFPYEDYVEELKMTEVKTPKKRETAAEKRVREAADRAEREAREWAEFTANYAVRFVSLVYNYAKLDYAQFRVEMLDAETYMFSREDYRFSEVVLKVTPPAVYSWEFKHEMEQAESLLADYAADQAEEARKRDVRANALSKLTAEERELLDL